MKTEGTAEFAECLRPVCLAGGGAVMTLMIGASRVEEVRGDGDGESGGALGLGGDCIVGLT